MRGNALAKILRRIANAVERFDEVELEHFLTDLGHKEFSLNQSKQKNRVSKNKHAKIDPVALDELLVRLSNLPTRSAGAQLLDQLDLGRKELEALARLRSIHVTKADDVARIKEKLIEVTIGARLSSRAIRGAGDSD